MQNILLLAKLTFLEHSRNRWMIYFGLGFAALAFLFSFVGSSDTETFSSFDRSSVMLLNIMMLFIPLLGFALGAQAISGDREGGALMYLLSQPISKNQYFFGKFLGCAWILSTAITAGLAIAAVGVALSGSGNLGSFLILWVIAVVFILVCTAIGMVVSVFTSNRSRAIGTAIFAWLGFTVLSDLGLMATAQALRLRSEGIVGLTLFNPVEVFKILAIRCLSSNLEVLGIGGIYLDTIFGPVLPYLLMAWLLVIMLLALLLARYIFASQEEY